MNKKNVKVCHMSSVHPNNDRRIFVAECSSLAENGYDVYFIARGKSRVEHGVNVVGLGNFDGGRMRRIFYFTRKVYRKALDLNCDIYHIHDPELLLYALKLKKHGKRVIFDSHEFYSEQLKVKSYLPKVMAAIIAKLYGIYEKYVLKHIDGVIFPCLLNGRNPFRGKCRNTAIVNNTPILSELYDMYDEKADKEAETICCIGALSSARGITNTVKSAYNSGCRLYLAGVFQPESYKDELKRMEEYKCVEYKGVINRDEVLELLKKSVVGASIQLKVGQYEKCDNLPTKVYEFMAMGIPVVMNKAAYYDKVLREYKFGITVNANDINAISSAFSYLTQNPDIAKKMGDEGRRAIREKYNWKIDEKHLLWLYKKVMGA